MIFRRIKAHIEKENWFAVFIDFAIVVVGVFIGIQVANWNDARQGRLAQDKMIERLHADFKSIEPVVEALHDFNVSSYQSTRLVIDALRLEAPPTNDDAFRFALARANWVQSVPSVSPTYKELVSSGTLSDLSDGQLRTALTRYGDTHERLERLYPAATTVILNPQSNYYKSVDWDMDISTWESSDAIVHYDWETLRESRGEMQAWIAYQYDLALFAKTELETIRAVIARLEELRP